MGVCYLASECHVDEEASTPWYRELIICCTSVRDGCLHACLLCGKRVSC
jgi:hypothetical protein